MKFTKLILFIVILLGLIFSLNKSIAMTHYQTVGTTTGLVTASALNVREGPGTNFKSIGLVYKNEYIRIFASIGDWYVIQTDVDYVGCVSKKYVKLIYPNTSSSGNSSSGNTETTTSSELTEDEKEVFNLINAKRIENRII